MRTLVKTMRIKYGGYIFVVTTHTDYDGALCEFKMYQERKYWFNKLLNTMFIRRDKITGLDQGLDIVIEDYENHWRYAK